MFRCYFCNEVTLPGTKKHNVVVETRAKTYPSRRAERKRPRGRFGNRQDAPSDVGGKGVETKHEVAACPACAAKQSAVGSVLCGNEPGTGTE